MTGPELGYLLLGSHLGDPTRRPLTAHQLTRLRQRVQHHVRPTEEGQVSEALLRELGYTPAECNHILSLLSQVEQALSYLQAAERHGLRCITRCSEDYPRALTAAEKYAPPAVLWAKGNTTLLHTPQISLVGSREAKPENLCFAQTVGSRASQQHLTLVSGGARGIDSAGQFACRNEGGKVICVIPDELTSHYVYGPDVLLLCEDSFDLRFSHQRALSRNHVIHILGRMVFVAQCNTHGGTWSGTTENLKHHWSPVYCFQDGSPAMAQLMSMGAEAVEPDALDQIEALGGRQSSLFSAQ